MNKHDLIVDKMYNNDAFSKWLGIEIIDIKDGYCKLSMKVTKDMLNGFDTVSYTHLTLPTKA